MARDATWPGQLEAPAANQTQNQPSTLHMKTGHAIAIAMLSAAILGGLLALLPPQWWPAVPKALAALGVVCGLYGVLQIR